MEKSWRLHEKSGKMDCINCALRYPCRSLHKGKEKKESLVNEVKRKEKRMERRLMLIKELMDNWQNLYDYDLISKDEYLELLYTAQDRVFSDIRKNDLWEDLIELGIDRAQVP